MPRKKQAGPLTGDSLLKKVQKLENASKTEKAKACGYVTQTKNGQERVNLLKFQNALLDAMGMKLDGTSSDGRMGRKPSYRIRVQSNGSLLIGSAYTSQMGLEPGDEFEIRLGRKHIKLNYIQHGEDVEDEEEDEETDD